MFPSSLNGPSATASPAREWLISRPQLHRLLDGAGRVALVCAPAGYGKTSLLRSWSSDVDDTRRLAWVTVVRGEDDRRSFWASVLQALRAICEVGLIRDMAAAPDLDGSSIVGRLLADLDALVEPVWLVIDDLHVLPDDVIVQLNRLIERAPEHLRFVLGSRRDAELTLHLLRLEGELTEIRSDELRFSLKEARALLAATDVSLSEDALTALLETTEGWPAGLRLAAVSMRRHTDPERFARRFRGTDRTVDVYLVTEVLAHLPEKAQRLLLHTSILDRVSGPLADELTGEIGGAYVLAELESEGAFVVALDTERTWFRYHRLFADLLLQQLRLSTPNAPPALHRAASRWFAEHELILEAVDHAQAAGEWEMATELLFDEWFTVSLDGREGAARAALEGFPRQIVADQPELALLVADDRRLQGLLYEAEGFLEIAADSAHVVAAPRLPAFELGLATVKLSIASARNNWGAVVADAQAALSASQTLEAGARRPDEGFHAIAMLNLAIAELWTDQPDQADAHLHAVLEEARRIRRPLLEVRALCYLAVLARFRSPVLGEQQALDALELARRHGLESEECAGLVQVILSTLCLWGGRMREAETWLQRAESVLREDAQPTTLLVLHNVRGLVYFLRGEEAEAMTAFEAASRAGRRLVDSHALASRVQAHRLQLMILRGELDLVATELDALPTKQRDLGEMRVVRGMLSLARHDWKEALDAVTSAPGAFASFRDSAWTVQSMLVAARAEHELGDPGAAETHVERALALAEGEGPMLSFLFAATPDLLERHRKTRTSHASLVRELLHRMTRRHSGEIVSAGIPMREVMSDAERRVLRYLPTNLRAPEIATELGISPATVRTHTRRIYAKLAVHKRADAVQKARALGLLAPLPDGDP